MLTLMASNGSHLRYITKTASQRQATVKFHGVFASHWKSLAFAPGKSFQENLVWDTGDLVIPFMHVDIPSTRYYAHSVTTSFRSGLTFLLNSIYRYMVRTISYKLKFVLAY